MKQIIFLFSFAALALMLAACDDYLDVNTDPNRTQTVTLDALLPATIEATSNNHYLVGNITGQFTQHIASYFVGGTDSYQETRIPLAWPGIYLAALNNLNILVREANAQSSPHYAGIGKILQAVNLGMATDAWGDVPFSDAFQSEANLKPAFDSQQAIYDTLNTLLTDAIALLQQPTSTVKPGADDIVYGGKLASWIKAAYALKARYSIHLTGRNEASAIAAALAAVPLAISSNAEDFQLNYSTVNRNPWYNNVSSPITTGNFTVGPSEQIVNLMNGTYYAPDPRLAKMFERTGTAPYSGLVNGQGGGGNTRLSTTTWYAGATSPMLMVTFAEVKFIQAEASLRNGAADDAYAAYLAGIAAHMEKLSIDTAARRIYRTHPSIAVGSANLTLEHIMKEKYIATFLNPEAWTDVRRFQYSSAIYQGMSKPANYNEALGGEFIRRVLYPNDEINRNGAAISAHIKPMQTKMWWEN